jgi:two-component system LytT family response regulator
MRIAIVEDEIHQQENLIRYLKNIDSSIRIVGVADSVTKAVELLSKSDFDLAILDVMIKGGTSFDALSKLDDINFQMVFTTSFDTFAVKAFRLSAIDYVLKPFGEDEITETIEKVKERLDQLVAKERFDLLFSNYYGGGMKDEKIAFPDQSSYTFIRPKEIIRCESDNNYTRIFLKDKSILVSKTLKVVEETLKEKGFYRIHNRALINLDCIESITKGGDAHVVMSDGSEVPISRRKRDDFMQVFQKL